MDGFDRNLGKAPGEPPEIFLTLDHQDRARTRGEARLSDGTLVRLFLPRGRPMEDGDLLESSASGRRILVKAAKEDLFLARAESWEELSRAAYHFGNRHAALELGDLFLKFPPDPVLEEMARRLGLKLERVEEPFRPERASYHSHGGD